MITIATLLWAPTDASKFFSCMYDESWVEKLYRGFRRNITGPMEFICYVDKEREFTHPEIHQRLIETQPLGYEACLEPYKLDVPTILVGLDTIVLGNIDHLAEHAMRSGRLAVPRDPYHPHTVCNGVALIPQWFGHIWHDRRPGVNDMVWIRSQPDLDVIDDLFPGEVVSYKGHIKQQGSDGVRIAYFHGEEKPHQLDTPWIREHWV